MVQDATSKSIYFYSRQMKIELTVFIQLFHTAVRYDGRRAEVSVCGEQKFQTQLLRPADMNHRAAARSVSGWQGSALLMRHPSLHLASDSSKISCLLTSVSSNIRIKAPCKSHYKILGTLFSERRVLLLPSSSGNGRNQTAQ